MVSFLSRSTRTPVADYVRLYAHCVYRMHDRAWRIENAREIMEGVLRGVSTLKDLQVLFTQFLPRMVSKLLELAYYGRLSPCCSFT